MNIARRTVTAALCLLSWAATGNAAGSLIPIMPKVSSGVELPDAARKILESKVKALAVESGCGASSSHVVLTADVDVVDKSVTASAPPMYVTDLEVHFYVADVEEEVVLAHTSVTVRGIESAEPKTAAAALKKINPKSAELKEFMKDAVQKVGDYYAQRIPVIMKKAQGLADQGEFSKALLLLSNVPDTVPQWEEVNDLSVKIFHQLVDLEADELLHKADVALAEKDEEYAMECLGSVSPMSSRFADAKKKVASIKAAALQTKLETLAQEYEAVQEDNARSQEVIQAYVVKEQAMIQEQNQSIEKKLTSWLLGSLRKDKKNQQPQVYNV